MIVYGSMIDNVILVFYESRRIYPKIVIDISSVSGDRFYFIQIAVRNNQFVSSVFSIVP